jgi:hypothetical protein
MAENALKQSLLALSRVATRPAVAARFAEALPTLANDVERAIVGEIAAFSASGNPAILPELRDHIADHLAEMHRLLGGARAARLEFVRRHAARRAEQRFPLEALLHAYRIAHKLLSRWLHATAAETTGAAEDPGATLGAIADFALEYTDIVSTTATAEYVRRTRQLTEAEADRRSQLLSILLEGYDEGDGRVARLLRSAGYLDQRQSYCVILARSVDPREMHNAPRANRLLAALKKTLEDLPFRTLFGFSEHRVVAVVAAARRQSGWTAPHAALAGRIAWPLLGLGNAVLAGVSADAASTALIPRALREAELALQVADAGQRVVEFSSIPLRRLLLHSATGSAQPALPAWSGALLAADRRSRGVLIDTLRAYAGADMNVLTAAKRLSVHPNTVYARFKKIRDATSLDPSRFHALTELLLAVDLAGER